VEDWTWWRTHTTYECAAYSICSIFILNPFLRSTINDFPAVPHREALPFHDDPDRAVDDRRSVRYGHPNVLNNVEEGCILVMHHVHVIRGFFRLLHDRHYAPGARRAIAILGTREHVGGQWKDGHHPPILLR
jgi:hypothetical protein